MREILFRGKSKITNEWVYGYYSQNTHYKEHYIYTNDDFHPHEAYRKYIIKGSTLGQFTGLKDKNGVKIFEGDLLDDSYNDDDGNLIEDHSEVIFNVLKGEWSIDNSFKKDKSSLTNLVRYFRSELKVIGNIYDI